MEKILVIENSQGNLIVNINDGEHIFHLNKSLEYFPSKHETATGRPMEKIHWEERVNHAYPKTPYRADDTIIKRIPHLLKRRKNYLKKVRSPSNQEMNSKNETQKVSTFSLGASDVFKTFEKKIKKKFKN